MLENKILNDLKGKYQKRSLELPSFIDTRSNFDYYAYAHYREILNVILALIKSDLHSDRHIRLLIDKANENMDNIFKIYDSKSSELKFILISEKVITFTEDLLEDLIEGELYEAAANLRKFNENFYRIDE